MKGIFKKSSSNIHIIQEGVDSHPKDAFRFNFFEPTKVANSAPSNTSEGAKKKKKKKKSKKKASNNSALAEGAGDQEEDNDVEDEVVNQALNKIEAKLDELTIIDNETSQSDPYDLISNLTADDGADDPARLPQSNKKRKKSKKKSSTANSDNMDNIDSTQESAVDNVTLSPHKPLSVIKSKKKANKATKPTNSLDDDEFDRILEQFTPKEAPTSNIKKDKVKKPFMTEDKKVRIFSPNDPELDPKLRIQAKYGKGKNLVAIGPPKKRDPHWLTAPPGLEKDKSFAAVDEETAKVVKEVKEVKSNAKEVEREANALHSSPFSFSFSFH